MAKYAFTHRVCIDMRKQMKTAVSNACDCAYTQYEYANAYNHTN